MLRHQESSKVAHRMEAVRELLAENQRALEFIRRTYYGGIKSPRTTGRGLVPVAHAA